MADFIRQLRRAATQLAIRQAIVVTAGLPIGPQRSVVRSLVGLAGGIPMLRWKVRENMRLALGQDIPPQAERRYFRHLGWALSSSLPTLHYGLAATPVPQEVKFDGSIRLLDEAVVEGRGVVLTVPHWSGADLAGAVIGRRHPMAMLVRPAPTSERAARKLKWYNALGVETVYRPSGTSTIKAAVAYLNILKKGYLLVVAPDLLAGAGQGVEICIFGRKARLHGGGFALAIAAKAPMIRVSGQWQPDSSVVLSFDRAPPILDARDRDAAIRVGVQDWCCWFEEKLRANPENWQFWLDKRWSRFLHSIPRAPGSE
jgi:lauroyl/myristoyl acyltransferase